MLEAITNIRKQMMTPEEFSKKYQFEYNKGLIYPVCPYCKRRLHLYGISSATTKARFDHPDGSDDCELSDPKKAKKIPSYDFDNNDIIEKIRSKENLRRIYAVCKKFIEETFGKKEFDALMEIGEEKNIFYYRNLQVWMIPYILITLKDFSIQLKSGRKTNVRFVMKDLLIGTLEGKNIKNEIHKVYADSGKKIKEFPMEEREFNNIDIKWINFI